MASHEVMLPWQATHHCPSCGDNLPADHMDIAGEWKHSAAMTARYCATCCVTCTDEHRISEDGVLCGPDDGVEDCDGLLWSTQRALEDAEYEAACEFADRRMMAGWTR